MGDTQDLADIAAEVEARVQLEEAELANYSPAAGQNEPAAEPFKFNVLSGKDILALKRPEWRIKGLLPESGIAVMYGPSRAGKSFAILDMALSVARGETWFTRKTVPCEILYICLESTWGLQGRLKAWMLETGNPLPDNLHYLIEPFSLLSNEHIEAIIKAAPVNGMVIVDTLNRAAPGTDENSSKDMSTMIQAVSKIQIGTQGLVVLVAHSGKDSTKGIRGHSSLIAALDSSLEVGRENNSDMRFLKIDKVKEGEDGVKQSFILKTVVIGMDKDGDPITSCIVEPVGSLVKTEKPLSPALQYALSSFEKATEAENTTSLHIDTWRKYFNEGSSADTPAAKRMSFNRARKQLLESEILSVENDYYKRTNANTTEQCSNMFATHNANEREHTSLDVFACSHRDVRDE
jgi:hypothetical protein